MTVIDLLVSDTTHGGGRYLERAWDTGSYHSVGNHYSTGADHANYSFAYFYIGNSITPASVIDSAYYSITRYFGAGQPKTIVRLENAGSSSPPTSEADHQSRVRTVNGVVWNPGFPRPDDDRLYISILSLVNEVKSLSPVSVVVLHDDNGSATGSSNRVAYDPTDQGASFGPGIHIEYHVPNTSPAITVSPTVSYGSLTRLGPNNTPATVSFTAVDADGDSLTYQIRTGASGGGTLVGNDNATSGLQVNHSLAHNASGLNEGTNTLYLRASDGQAWSADAPFTVLVDRTAPTVGTIISTPSPVTGGG